MSKPDSLHSLTAIVEAIDKRSEQSEPVSVSDALDVIGRRSFGPILTIIGLFMVIPGISDIPGVPTILGGLIVLIGGQLMFHRQHIWLPQWLLKRSVKQKHLQKTLSYAKRPVGWIDSVLKQRLIGFSASRYTWYIVAACAISVALATPAMEVVPFSGNVAGLSILLFGLALIAEDGVVLLLGFATYLITVAIVVNGVLSF